MVTLRFFTENSMNQVPIPYDDAMVLSCRLYLFNILRLLKCIVWYCHFNYECLQYKWRTL